MPSNPRYHRTTVSYRCLVDFERPVLRSVDVDLDEVVTVTVELEADGSRHQGQAEGSIDTTARARVVGEATLRALESVIGTGKFELAAVGTSTLDEITIALVQVNEAGTTDAYVGSALIRRGDVVLATARAVLDALNRRLALIR